MLGFVGLFAVVGSLLLFNSHAATPYANVAANSGTLAGGAAAQTCSGSTTSNSQCVTFNGTGNTGGGTDTNKGVPWIGLEGIHGWGPPLSNYIMADGFRWERVDEQESGTYQAGSSAATDANTRLSDGSNLDILLPTDTNQAMSWMNAYKSYGSRVIFEFWNEPWTSSNGTPAIPAGTYAQEYEAAYNAKHAPGTGITQPLLFMTIGEAYSTDNTMWLQRAMASGSGVPNLKVDAFSAHPYGEANQDNSHSYGVDALVYDRNDAVSRGFTNTPWYVTEFGFTLNPAQVQTGSPNASSTWYVPSYAEQAKQITAAYNEMIQYGDGDKGTWLQGILYYQAHDDSTGWFGLLTSPNAPSHDNAGEIAGGEKACTTGQPPPPCGTANTPIIPRPGYFALKAFLTNH